MTPSAGLHYGQVEASFSWKGRPATIAGFLVNEQRKGRCNLF